MHSCTSHAHSTMLERKSREEAQTTNHKLQPKAPTHTNHTYATNSHLGHSRSGEDLSFGGYFDHISFGPGTSVLTIPFLQVVTLLVET
jgi:hypothetical protein